MTTNTRRRDHHFVFREQLLNIKTTSPPPPFTNGLRFLQGDDSHADSSGHSSLSEGYWTEWFFFLFGLKHSQFFPGILSVENNLNYGEEGRGMKCQDLVPGEETLSYLYGEAVL